MSITSIWLVLVILSAIWYVLINHIVTSPEHGPIRSMISVGFVIMLLFLLAFASGIVGNISISLPSKG